MQQRGPHPFDAMESLIPGRGKPSLTGAIAAIILLFAGCFDFDAPTRETETDSAPHDTETAAVDSETAAVDSETAAVDTDTSAVDSETSDNDTEDSNVTDTATCDHECSEEGETTCEGGVLKTCKAGDHNCRTWETVHCDEGFCFNNASCGTITIAELGTTALDRGHALDVDGNDDLWVTGFTRGDFAGNFSYAGETDVFLTHIPKGDITDEGSRTTIQWGTAEHDQPQILNASAGDGNIYVGGWTLGDLGTLGSPYQTTNQGAKDVFVATVSLKANLESIAQFGSDMNDFICGIVPGGTLFFMGYSAGDIATVSQGGFDIYVGSMLWASQIGSSENDVCSGSHWLPAEGENDALMYLAGSTSGTMPGSKTSNLGRTDAFVFDGTNTVVQLGTAEDDSARGVTTDNQGNVYLVGSSKGNFDGQPNANAGKTDVFLSKLSSALEKQWTVLWGSAEADYPAGVVVDADDNIYVGGTTFGDLDGQGNRGEDDIFLTKLSPAGKIVWTVQWGTDKSEDVKDIAIDSKGSVYLTGETPADILLVKYSATN